MAIEDDEFGWAERYDKRMAHLIWEGKRVGLIGFLKQTLREVGLFGRARGEAETVLAFRLLMTERQANEPWTDGLYWNSGEAAELDSNQFLLRGVNYDLAWVPFEEARTLWCTELGSPEEWENL